jgi:hypothetical protein
MRQADALIFEVAVTIRATMIDYLDHLLEFSGFGGNSTREIYYSCDTTHKKTSRYFEAGLIE